MSAETNRLTIPAAEEILNRYFPVLDHGFVALVDYMGGDAAIEQAARVSYGGNAVAEKPRTKSETRNLLRYMSRHKHTSVNEMVELKFHCSMPIFVARQWVRHRTASLNEMSGRYSLMPMLFYTPPDDQMRLQSKTNKQGREDTVIENGQLKEMAVRGWGNQRESAVEQYNWLIGHDFARELARIDLPLSTYTQWYWKIDLHNLLHFLTLRVDAHAQWEIQQFGKVMAGMLKRVAPLSYEAWIDYEVCGAKLSRMELDIIRSMRNVGYETVLEDLAKEKDPPGGMTSRELDELTSLLASKPVPDFELDLGAVKPASFFEEQAAAAVPKTK